MREVGQAELRSRWIRLDQDLHLDLKLLRSGAALIWPHVLCILKRGWGRVAVGDLCGEALAPILRPLDVEEIDEQIEALKRVGLLVVEGDRVTTPNWDRYQPDSRAASRDRQEAHVSRVVPDTPGLSLGRSGLSRVVPGHDDDDDDDVEQDLRNQPDLGVGVVASTEARARGPTTATATGPAAPEPDTPGPTALRRVVDAYLGEIPATQRRGRVQTTSSETSGLHELLAAHGEDLVLAGIREAGRANTQERISVAFVVSVCRRMAAGGGRKPAARATGRRPTPGTYVGARAGSAPVVSSGMTPEQEAIIDAEMERLRSAVRQK